jgi:hypothetical protein
MCFCIAVAATAAAAVVDNIATCAVVASCCLYYISRAFREQWQMLGEGNPGLGYPIDCISTLSIIIILDSPKQTQASIKVEASL